VHFSSNFGSKSRSKWPKMKQRRQNGERTSRHRPRPRAPRLSSASGPTRPHPEAMRVPEVPHPETGNTPRHLEVPRATHRVVVRAHRTPARAARRACRLLQSGPPRPPIASRLSLRALHA
jgi:hypothetical protein